MGFQYASLSINKTPQNVEEFKNSIDGTLWSLNVTVLKVNCIGPNKIFMNCIISNLQHEFSLTAFDTKVFLKYLPINANNFDEIKQNIENVAGMQMNLVVKVKAKSDSTEKCYYNLVSIQ